MRRRGANSCEAQNRHASAANPKFAQVCGALGCELRVQKRHYKDRVAGVLIDSEVRTSAPQMLTNFGIGTPSITAASSRGARAQPLYLAILSIAVMKAVAPSSRDLRSSGMSTSTMIVHGVIVVLVIWAIGVYNSLI